jgi:hypothetical protein
MIITVASSDKLTLSMFGDFYKSIYSSDIKMVDLNCLYSEDILETKIKGFLEIARKGRDILIRFKMKAQTKEVSPILIENSDLLIKFDIFSTEPEVIKDCGSDTYIILDRWRKNIERFNQQRF